MAADPSWTVAGLAQAVRNGKLSPVELVRESLARIERTNATLHAFITVDAEGALAAARGLEAEGAAGRWRGALHGVPLAYKDLCVVPGLPTSCGTKRRDYWQAVPCTAVRRLAAAGAITVGKLNMTELALGPFGDNAHHGDVDNPRARGHVAGGSSSGSGAAVAAELVPGALGSDTGGSIRLPAAACGIVGLKPTYGRVSRAGVMPLSWTMDHVGPMASTVQDVALMLQTIAGPDPADATARSVAVPDYAGALEGSIAGLRVGVPRNFYFDDLDVAVARGVEEALRVLERLGARLEALEVPDPHRLSQEVSTPVVQAEAAATHARLLREHPDEVQPVVRSRVAPGFEIPAVTYLGALRRRAELAREFVDSIMSRVDVLVAPTIPEPAPSYARVKAGAVDEIVRRMARFSRLTRPINALGLPALSLPCGAAPDGRPVAVQIIGRPFEEATILRAAAALERAR